jgi:segregation and condensation protein A
MPRMEAPSDPAQADPARTDTARADPAQADPARADTAHVDPPADSLLLRLEGFEGPLDLLLDLARAQKVDLIRISILALVEQYLAVIEGARRVRLELAADWLVMAAWLTWLKSRLLVPASPDDAEEGELAAETLAERLRELGAIRTAAAWLGSRPVLGQDVFARGAPEDHSEIDRSRLVIDMGSFMRSYLQAIRRGTKATPYRPRALTLWTVQDALRRLGMLLGSLPDWASLEQYLPETLSSPTERRAALASTLLAGLEMARDGTVRLRQDDLFGPILVHRGTRAIEEGA